MTANQAKHWPWPMPEPMTLGGYMVEDYTASNTQEEVDKNVENGITFKFDTIEELCEHCGFDKDIFMATFERYNELCEAGEDLDFYKDPLWMNAIDTPPFYASKHCSSMTSTRGGLKNDERCRVLDKEGRPIPGLYAAGEVTGGIHGGNRLGGNAIVEIFVSGRTAANAVAADAE